MRSLAASLQTRLKPYNDIDTPIRVCMINLAQVRRVLFLQIFLGHVKRILKFSNKFEPRHEISPRDLILKAMIMFWGHFKSLWDEVGRHMEVLLGYHTLMNKKRPQIHHLMVTKIL